jgi:hypothetical protein
MRLRRKRKRERFMISAYPGYARRIGRCVARPSMHGHAKGEEMCHRTFWSSKNASNGLTGHTETQPMDRQNDDLESHAAVADGSRQLTRGEHITEDLTPTDAELHQNQITRDDSHARSSEPRYSRAELRQCWMRIIPRWPSLTYRHTQLRDWLMTLPPARTEIDDWPRYPTAKFP